MPSSVRLGAVDTVNHDARNNVEDLHVSCSTESSLTQLELSFLYLHSVIFSDLFGPTFVE